MASGNSHFYQKIFHLLIIAISYTNGYSVPMKWKSFTHLLFWLGFALALQQCAPPTPMERITRNSSLYMAQPKDHQRLIERGELARGMTREAVSLAWGNPSQTFEGTENGNLMERWSYLGRRNVYQDNFALGYGNAWGGPWGTPWCYGPGQFQNFGFGQQISQIPYQKAFVIFKNNKVDSWERLKLRP